MALARLKRHVSSLTKHESNCFLASSLNFTLPLMSHYFKINAQGPVTQHQAVISSIAMRQRGSCDLLDEVSDMTHGIDDSRALFRRAAKSRYHPRDDRWVSREAAADVQDRLRTALLGDDDVPDDRGGHDNASPETLLSYQASITRRWPKPC